MTELGSRLKQAREAKGLSLEDLQTVTKIQKRYLIGIEEGNYTIMPGQFYARAFIRQYAEAVGLDPEEIFEEYNNEIPANEKEDIPQLSRVKTRKKVTNTNTKVLNFIPRVLVVLVIIAIIAIIYVVMQSWDRDGNTGQGQTGQDIVYDSTSPGDNDEDDEESGEDEQDPDVEDADEQAIETPSAGTLTEVEKSGTNATFELTEADKFEVELTSTGDPWVGIYNGKGNTFFSDTVKEGQTESYDFTEEEEILFNIGRAYETKLTINGEPFEFPFPPNEVITQRITIKFSPNGEQ